MVDLSLFSKIKENSFTIVGKWDWSWRKSDRGYNFARYTRHISNKKTIINISNRMQCAFNLEDLKTYEQKPLDMQKYYSFNEIWKWAREMPAEQVVVEQEL